MRNTGHCCTNPTSEDPPYTPEPVGGAWMMHTWGAFTCRASCSLPSLVQAAFTYCCIHFVCPCKRSVQRLGGQAHQQLQEGLLFPPLSATLGSAAGHGGLAHQAGPASAHTNPQAACSRAPTCSQGVGLGGLAGEVLSPMLQRGHSEVGGEWAPDMPC